MADPLVITDRITIPAEDLDATFSRASGPGGQHVNTTDTRVRLRFALQSTAALHEDVKERLRQACGVWLTQDGDLVLTCDSSRSKTANLDEARERLATAVRAALVPPKPRRKTKPSKGSQQRRLQGKKQRKDVKAARGRVRED
jgi:ribosome-associated protein